MPQNESVPAVPRCEVCGEEMHMFCISEGAHTRREWRCFSVHEAHQMNPKCKVCGRKMELKPRSLFNWNLDDNWICPATPDQHRNAELEREAKKKDVRIEELEDELFSAEGQLLARSAAYDMCSDQRDILKARNEELEKEVKEKNEALQSQHLWPSVVVESEAPNLMPDGKCSRLASVPKWVVDQFESKRDTLKARNEELEKAVLAQREALERFGGHPKETVSSHIIDMRTHSLYEVLDSTASLAAGIVERIEREALEKVIGVIADPTNKIVWIKRERGSIHADPQSVLVAILGTQQEGG